MSHPRQAGSGGHGSCKLQSSKYRGEPESAKRTSNRDHRAGLCLHGKELVPLSAEAVGSSDRPSARDTWVGDAGWVQRGTQVPAANRCREGGLPHPAFALSQPPAGWTRPPHVGRTVCCSQATDSSVHPGTPSPTHPACRPSVRASAVQPSSSVKSNTSLGGGGPVSVSGGAWASPSACPLPDPASRTSLTTGSFQPRGRPSLSIGYRPWQPESFHPWSQFPGHLLVLVTFPRNLLPRSPS